MEKTKKNENSVKLKDSNVSEVKFYFSRFWTLLIVPVYYLFAEILTFYAYEDISITIMDYQIYAMIISMILGYVNNYLLFSRYAELCVFMPLVFTYLTSNL